ASSPRTASSCAPTSRCSSWSRHECDDTRAALRDLRRDARPGGDPDPLRGAHLRVRPRALYADLPGEPGPLPRRVRRSPARAPVSRGAGGNPADGPYLFTSASRDGRAVLLTVNVPGARSTVLLLRPEAGDARELYRGSPFDRAVISADGTRYALSRAADDPAVNGVWVGTLGAGAPRRLVADDPSASGAP